VKLKMVRKFWKRDITYYELLELITFWGENYPSKIREIPEKLSHKIKQEDVNYLQGPYREKGGKISSRGLEELRIYIESKIIEIEKEESNLKWQKEQIYWTKVLAIGTIIALIISGIALISSIQSSNKSNNLSQKVIEMTPSKYAYIDFSLSDYFGNMIIYPLTNIDNQKYVPMGINIINTGNLNTGKISISKRDEFNSDDTLDLYQVIIQDIGSQTNNASLLKFDVLNYSKLLGLHQINLSIYCPNCIEQDKVRNPEVVYICVYNDTEYSGSERYRKAIEHYCKN